MFTYQVTSALKRQTALFMNFALQPISSLADQDLIRRYHFQRDTQALAQLFKRQMRRVYGWCLSYLKSDLDSQDAVMEIYLIVEKELRQQLVQNWEDWLFVITRNYCYRTLKKSRKWRALFNSAPDLVDLAEPATSPLEEPSADENQLLDRLLAALDRLNEKQRRCLVYHYFDGLSYRSIAEKLCCKESQVKSYLQNGRRQLRKQVQGLP